MVVFLLQKCAYKFIIYSMKKQIKLTDLDCTICANKLQDAVSKIDGVNSVSVSFFTQKMVLDFDETKYATVKSEIIKVKKKILPDVQIIGL